MITAEQEKAILERINPQAARCIAVWLRGVTRDDPAQLAQTHLSIDHVHEKVDTIRRYLPGLIDGGSRVLEIGTGFGAFACYTRALYGWNVFGCEPDESAVRVAHELGGLLGSDRSRFTCNNGERLPFAGDSFDLVYASNVIEHVQDPDLVLAEALRVVRPGGHVFFTFPNYGSWWEGHYGILWPPNIGKPLARLYVRLYGRDPAYIDTLNFMNIRYVRRMLARVAGQVTLVTLGEDLWEDRLTTMKFGAWGSSGRLKRMLGPLHRFNFLLRPLIALGRALNWFYPIILVMRKNG